MPICQIEIDASEESVQTIRPPGKLQRFEGVAFAPMGNVIAVATSDTNTVFLYRQDASGRFEEMPYSSLEGQRAKLNYPHDVCFARYGDSEVLAVAQRGGAIAIYEKPVTCDSFTPDPAFEIYGPKTKLDYSDGVSFVPPDSACLAACNLTRGTISFYRLLEAAPIRFEVEPVFELKHESLCNPDGLAFSRCGQWLAIANHGNHSVSIFSRTERMWRDGKMKYGPRPITIIKDPALRHPHSLAFTPEGNHLVVTNAGANYFSIYSPRKFFLRTQWSQSSVTQKTFGPESIFREVHAHNKMEGGPKGVAVYKNSLAMCSPEHGLKIYTFQERHFG